MNDLQYFWTFLKASLFSSGGTGNLPILHAGLTAAHAATGRQFAEALAIGQLSPGPSGLWAVSLGYLTRGLPGSLLAAIGITLPPFAILAIRRAFGSIHDHPVAIGFMRGLTSAVVGISIVVLFLVLKDTGLRPTSIVIAAVAAVIGAVKRIPVIAIFGLAAAAGVLLGGG